MNKEDLKRVEQVIEEHKNPYPKDIFLWTNKEKLKFNRGRFNEFIFNIVENTKKDILKEIKEREEDMSEKVIIRDKSKCFLLIIPFSSLTETEHPKFSCYARNVLEVDDEYYDKLLKEYRKWKKTK